MDPPIMMSIAGLQNTPTSQRGNEAFDSHAKNGG